MAKLPCLHGVTLWRGMTYVLFHPGFVWVCAGQLQQPIHDSSKMSLSPCHSHLHKLSLGHQAQSPINYFRTNHDRDHLKSRSCLVWPAAAHAHYSLWFLGSGGWPPQTKGMGWLHPLSPLAPITDPMAELAVQDLGKLGAHTGYLSTWIN